MQFKWKINYLSSLRRLGILLLMVSNYQMVNLVLFCCVQVALLLTEWFFLLGLKERLSKEYISMCLRKQPDIKKFLTDMLGRNCFEKN